MIFDSIQICLRNDIAENWFAINPVLLKGEVGIETNTNKIKIGDGVTDWRNLRYFNDISLIDSGTIFQRFSGNVLSVDSGTVVQRFGNDV